MCSANQKELLLAFDIDARQDKSTVHPQYHCNSCNTIMLQCNKAANIISRMIRAKWKEHTDRCTVCEKFQQRGRPRRCTAELSSIIRSLSALGETPSLSASKFKILLTLFSKCHQLYTVLNTTFLMMTW